MPEAVDARSSLWGTYRLIGTRARMLDTGEEEIYDNESGYITYDRTGRMMVLLVRGARPTPAGLDSITDRQCVELFRTVVAYSGPYTFDGRFVEHHIDVCHNQLWVGAVMRREIEREGRTVTLTTPPSPRGKDGRMSVRTLTFEQVE
jgi:hypothetical protein